MYFALTPLTGIKSNTQFPISFRLNSTDVSVTLQWSLYDKLFAVTQSAYLLLGLCWTLHQSYTSAAFCCTCVTLHRYSIECLLEKSWSYSGSQLFNPETHITRIDSPSEEHNLKDNIEQYSNYKKHSIFKLVFLLAFVLQLVLIEKIINLALTLILNSRKESVG